MRSTILVMLAVLVTGPASAPAFLLGDTEAWIKAGEWARVKHVIMPPALALHGAKKDGRLTEYLIWICGEPHPPDALVRFGNSDPDFANTLWEESDEFEREVKKAVFALQCATALILTSDPSYTEILKIIFPGPTADD